MEQVDLLKKRRGCKSPFCPFFCCRIRKSWGERGGWDRKLQSRPRFLGVVDILDGRDFLPKFASFPVWEIHVKFFYIFLRETDVLLKQIMLLSAASEANCQEKTRNQQKKFLLAVTVGTTKKCKQEKLLHNHNGRRRRRKYSKGSKNRKEKSFWGMTAAPRVSLFLSVHTIADDSSCILPPPKKDGRRFISRASEEES